jgi:signal peptidase II
MLKWLWLSLIIIILDLWTKSIASNLLTLHQPYPIFPGFNFTLMHNTGAAFSFLSEQGGWQRWFFTVVALGVSVVLGFWLKRLNKNQLTLAISLALILGGAIGNVWDRITLGYVVDFIQVYYDRWYWPAFNIADSAISVGAVLLIVDSIRNRKNTDASDVEDKEEVSNNKQ